MEAVGLWSVCKPGAMTRPLNYWLFFGRQIPFDALNWPGTGIAGSAGWGPTRVSRRVPGMNSWDNAAAKRTPAHTVRTLLVPYASESDPASTLPTGMAMNEVRVSQDPTRPRARCGTLS